MHELPNMSGRSGTRLSECTSACEAAFLGRGEVWRGVVVRRRDPPSVLSWDARGLPRCNLHFRRGPSMEAYRRPPKQVQLVQNGVLLCHSTTHSADAPPAVLLIMCKCQALGFVFWDMPPSDPARVVFQAC